MILWLLLLLPVSVGCKKIPASFHQSSINQSQLVDAPIPKDWVIDGKPVARSLDLTGFEGHGYTTGLWDCSEGTFNWYFHADEFVHILEGDVVVRGDDGKEAHLKVGDVAHFTAGSHTVWKVPNYVKKLWVLDNKPEDLFRRIQRKLTKER